MARLSRFSIARNDIIKVFDDLGKTYYNPKDLSVILNEHRSNWRLTKSMSLEDFLKELTSKAHFKKATLYFLHRIYTRYMFRNYSVFGLAAHLSSKSYLSHYTAMSFHGLTEQIPKSIYVTDEQAPKKPATSTISQEGIDKAFSNSPRVSNSIAHFDDYEIHLLKGKHTASLGVIHTIVDDLTVRITDLERTLIDIAVRPNYSGGVSEVLKAYELAKEKVSVNRLAALLSKLDFAYPYAQVIGYYLEKAEYPASLLNLFQKEPFKFDFYMAYGIQEKEYSSKWKLWHPAGL